MMTTPKFVSPVVENVSVKTGKPFMFETQVCGRCGGGGSYSFNLMHGSTCYGCGGHGIKLTKRGAAAQARFTELLSVPTSALEPGMKVRVQPGPFNAGGWREVLEVSVSTSKYKLSGDAPDAPWRCHGDEGRLDVRLEGILLCAEYASSPHRVAADAETKRAATLAAREYEASLTKAGKPRVSR
jgi:hypothetical protein